MDFSLREFVKSGLLLAVGKKADYEIKLSAADWLKIGVLLEVDLAEIQASIDAQYNISEKSDSVD